MQNRTALIVIGLLCISSLLVAACVPAGGGVVIKDPFARASPMGAQTGGAFMTIVNNGQAADRLVSASSSAAQAVELHETVDDNGVMKMVHHPEGWEIPAGGTLESEARRQAHHADRPDRAAGGRKTDPGNPELREGRGEND